MSHPITCATNANVSDSGCGNTGIGNSGVNNTGNGNSGDSNTGNANSGTSNTGNANSGVGNVGNGNSGCGNTGVANSGGGNTGTALSGGFSCSGFTVPKTTPRTVPKPPHTLPTATTIVPVTGETLPLTGSSSTAPLTLAGLLLFAGGATVTLANRRRRALAAVTGAEVPMSTAVGLLLTGRAKPADTTEPAKR